MADCARGERDREGRPRGGRPRLAVRVVGASIGYSRPNSEGGRDTVDVPTRGDPPPRTGDVLAERVRNSGSGPPRRLMAGRGVPGRVYRTGHWGAALLAYAPVGYLLLRSDPLWALVGAGVVLPLSTLPDVDHYLPVRHRGPTHSLLFLALVAAVLGAAGGVLGAGDLRPVGALPGVGLGAVLGVVGVGSHLLADMLTPMGVNPFWPLPAEPKSLNLTRAANPLANYTLLGLGLAASAGVLYVAGAA